MRFWTAWIEDRYPQVSGPIMRVYDGLIASLFMLLCPISLTYASEAMVPIHSLSANNASEINYIVKRCSAALMAIGARSGKNADMKTALEQHSEKFAGAVNASIFRMIEENREIEIGPALSRAAEDIERMAKLYLVIMDENYLRTGDQIGEFMADELSMCISISSSFL